MFYRVACVLLCATLIGAARTALSKYDNSTIIAYRSGVPEDSDWVELGTAQPDQVVTFTFALKQRNLDILEATLLDISNPKSPNYSKQWTRQQVLDLISPPRETVEEFLNWFRHAATKAGPKATYSVQYHGDALLVRSTVNFASILFNTTLYEFQSEALQTKVIKHMDELYMPGTKL
jgi:tripeptidyl-peptidase-1